MKEENKRIFRAHIPTENYAFIEVEAETIKEIIDEYFMVRDAFEKKLKDREDEKPPFDIQNPPINKHLKH